MIIIKNKVLRNILFAIFFISTVSISAEEKATEEKNVVQAVNDKKDTAYGYYEDNQWKKLSLGVSTAVGYGYYRRGFAVVADSTLPDRKSTRLNSSHVT